MKIVCLSDTHTRHKKLVVPDGDVLVHTGDFCSQGKVWEWTDFFRWFSGLPHKHKLFIAGNHDLTFEQVQQPPMRLNGVDYLMDSSIEIDGVKFYGAPWTPRFFDWAFNVDRGDPIGEKWKLIPDDTNVLLTHGPPFGILDLVPRGERVGCERLRQRVDELPNLKLHVFGHIHYSYGMTLREGRTFVNAANCTEQYEAVNEPIVVEL